MPHTQTVIIGAGQAGLALSRCLSDLAVEHVVLERGTVAQRWRSQSWDSLHLLTPNWMTRLPGFRYGGDDVDGFMGVADLIALLEEYARSFAAPVVSGATVRRVERSGDRFTVTTDRGTWSARAVVIATGYCDQPAVPSFARGLPPWLTQVTATAYRRPAELAERGVLIVGASSTGVQLADELQRSGRQVTLAVGRHTRLPRRYRGRDIFAWLDMLGALNQTADAVGAIEISRSQPSLQLVGRPDHSSLDLGLLRDRGVRIVGPVRGVEGRRIALGDEDLVASTAAADIKMAELLARIDRFIETNGIPAPASDPFRPTWPLAANGPARLDLWAERIETVIWATGFRRTYPWLQVPVVDSGGELVHDGGLTPVRGLYVLGMNFQRRRNSSFIDGVGEDARFIANHISRATGHARVA